MKIKATGGRNIAQCCYLRLFTNISSIFTSFFIIYHSTNVYLVQSPLVASTRTSTL